MEFKNLNPEEDYNESPESNEILISTEISDSETNRSQNLQECTTANVADEMNTNESQPNPHSSKTLSIMRDQKSETSDITEYINTKQVPLQISSNLPSLISVNMMLPNYPESLYLLALAKLHEHSLNSSIANGREQNVSQFTRDLDDMNRPELKTPDSLTSAPPSYSFVLRQMTRRRPRLMGTFIPSPSFVQHTPPPNYATAFDIYIDNPISPPPRVYRFSYMPMLMICPECGYIGVTSITTKITLSTHLCALVLCLLCCWVCAPLPYLLRSCKKVYHYCSNCRAFVGMYCPTNPENTTR